jgi:hypothetical protein
MKAEAAVVAEAGGEHRFPQVPSMVEGAAAQRTRLLLPSLKRQLLLLLLRRKWQVCASAVTFLRKQSAVVTHNN